jgi:hypothetical protein
MTYRPREEFFGPPFAQWIPAILHVCFATALAAFVFVVERGSQDSATYTYLFRRSHIISVQVVEVAFATSALAAVLRTQMRGVRVKGEYLEYRDLLASFWPKVRKIRWAQMDRVILHESGAVSVELWDGTTEFLPSVQNPDGLSRVLAEVALARAIAVTGAHRFDDLEALDPRLEDA